MSSDITRESFDPRKGYSSVRLQQGRVLTDADWNEQARIFQHALQSLSRSLFGPHALAPHDPDASFAISDVSWNDQQLRCLLQPGRYYVDGAAVENPGVRDFVFPVPADAGSVLLYLDAWEEEISALQDPALGDPALPGVDTSQRTRLAWRLRCMPLEPGVRVTDELPESLRRSRPARLRVRSAGYQGLENQLYRVQIQRAGRIGGTPSPSYKWARQNGSGLATVVGMEIRGEFLQFRIQPWPSTTPAWQDAKAGDWVEYSASDALDGEASLPLLRLLEVEGDLLTLQADAAELARLDALQGHPGYLRLWNQHGAAQADGGIPIDADNDGNGWQMLEHGIEIGFESGDVRVGDAWMIPARSTDGSVLWPAGQARPPDEPRRGAAPLAQVTRPGPGEPIHVVDCRHRVEIQRRRMGE